MLDLAQIVKDAGARFAAPTCLTYLSTVGKDTQQEKAKAVASSD